MKFIIKDNAYEEYRQILKKKATTVKEERQKMLSASYIFNPNNNEVIYDICFIASFMLYALILGFFFIAGEGDEIIDELIIELLPAFLISFLFTLLLQAYNSFKSTQKIITSWDRVLNACDNLSPVDFIKYMKTNYKHIYEEVELLQYFKNHPEAVLKYRTDANQDFVEIEYSRDGKVESEEFFFDSEETRIDITEDTLIWEMGEIKLHKLYKK